MKAAWDTLSDTRRKEQYDTILSAASATGVRREPVCSTKGKKADTASLSPSGASPPSPSVERDAVKATSTKSFARIAVWEEIHLKDMEQGLKGDDGSDGDQGCNKSQENIEGSGAELSYFTYPCRCGDFFEVSHEDLGADPSSSIHHLILPCGGCSLQVRLLLDPL